MKTRTGFVSNSSSSSFVVVGVPMTDKLEKKLKKMFPPSEGDDDWDWRDEDASELGLQVLYIERPHSHVIGKVLADIGSDGDFLAFTEYPFPDLAKMAAEVAEKLGGDVTVKMMLGTRPS